MPSLRQIEANRRNAQKSTGPVTDAGKARVARNALKHGLAGHGVVFTDEMTEAIEERKRHWMSQYRPDSPAQHWRFERIVIESVRADSCFHRSLALRDELARRASETWDDDRALDAERLGQSLADRPELVRPTLLQTRHGALWLLDRCDDLADRLARSPGDPTDADLSRLLDLLGVPASDRDDARTRLLETGSDPSEAIASLLDDTRADLRHRLDASLDDRDDRARIDAQSGLADDPAAVRLLDRYENQVLRRLRQAEADLRRLQSPPSAPLSTCSAPPTDPAVPTDPSRSPDVPSSAHSPHATAPPNAPAPYAGPTAQHRPTSPPSRPDRTQARTSLPSPPVPAATPPTEEPPVAVNRRQRRALKAWKRRHAGPHVPENRRNPLS
ncbi:hypothetical protein AB1L88_19915 [Tautonia sp. JC769]|uniref:hypothetical protein n=1 Tax=Tautonia sp. JC769 TaxID=3232135 RepID=UPI003458EB19